MFSHNAGEAVANAFVSLVGGNVLVGVLDLEKQLDALDGGDDRLGDGGGDTSDEEVGGEGSLLLLGSAHFSYCFFV